MNVIVNIVLYCGKNTFKKQIVVRHCKDGNEAMKLAAEHYKEQFGAEMTGHQASCLYPDLIIDAHN